MTVTFAIVGRPNVGKSTLFNRLIGRQHAIVDDQPGVTRDRREGQGYLATLAFTVIDTAGRVCFQYTQNDVFALELFEDSKTFSAARVESFWAQYNSIINL